MGATTSFNELAQDLQGMELSYLWRGYGSAIFIELGKLRPRIRRDGSPGNPAGEISIGIEWSWRIESTSSILCGSWSEEELWQSTFDLLRNTHVERLTIWGRLPEISLTLSDDLHLLSFSTTDGQPQWSVVDRRASKQRWFSVRDGALFEGDGTARAA